MSTSTPSTRVTGHPDTGPNSALCVIAGQKIRNSRISGLHMCRWFNGRLLAYHATGPGSIPSWCGAYRRLKNFIYVTVCR